MGSATSTSKGAYHDNEVHVGLRLEDRSLPDQVVPFIIGSSVPIDSSAELDIAKAIALEDREGAWEMTLSLPPNCGPLYYKFLLVSRASSEASYVAEECIYRIFNPYENSVIESLAVFKLGSELCKAWITVAKHVFANQFAKHQETAVSITQNSTKNSIFPHRCVSIKDLVLLGSEVPEVKPDSAPSTPRDKPRFEDHQGLYVNRSPTNLPRQKSAINLVNGKLQLNKEIEDMPEAVGAVAAAAVSERMLLPKERRQLAIVLVGLPARGKTFTAVKLTRYLRWLGHDTKHFNVGKYRRLKHGCTQTADFFRGDNAEGVDARNEVAAFAMEDMLSWMEEGGQIGVFDATNSTKERRAMILRMAEGKCKVIFLETICNLQSIIDRNIILKIQQSPDYANQPDFEAAVADFKARLANYEKVYEPVDQGSYIKMINIVTGEGGQIQVNGISGYLPGRIVFFLVNTHISPRPIFLTRHGESMYNLTGQIGGDPVLSPSGEAYALKLAEFINKHLESDTASIWTSTLQRTVLTARHGLPFPKVQWRALDEINAGICDGMTYEEIKEKMPEEYAARKADKLRYRYPRGESYLDVIQRLEPVIIELERQRAPVVVIAHQAVLRSLYAYFADKPLKEVPHIEVPLHTVIEIQMGVKGIEEKRHKLMEM